MAQKNKGASSTSTKPTAAEKKQWVDQNPKYSFNQDTIHKLRDLTKSAQRSIQTVNKEELRAYFKNIGGNEKNLRTTARYLYYRSNIFFRLINWYAGMWDLNCRKVNPKYDLTKTPNKNKFLKSYNSTLDVLGLMNMPGNMREILITVYREDVCYALTFLDDTGMFFYILDPDECVIDTRYSTGDFGFAMDMSKWRNSNRQTIIEYLGSPLAEMYEEYLKTGQRYIHCPDEYAACFKFRTDTWDIIAPPFAPLFLQLAALEDLVDIQAEADALAIYKLIYLPLKVLSGAKQSDEFEVTPDISMNYFQRMIDEGAIPDGVGAGVIPGDELKTIDFSKTVDSDTNSVEQASNQILQAAGGGAVINSSRITSTAAFNAWLKSETQFALATLMPQVNGFVNRMLSFKLNNPAKVEHFMVSVYTKKDLADQMLESCQYGYPNKIAYNTLLGVSEKETLGQIFLEEDILELHDRMKYPLSSSFTQSSSDDDYTPETGQGAPTKDPEDLSESGDRMRNK